MTQKVTPLNDPLSRIVTIEGVDTVITLTNEGVSMRPAGKHKSVSLTYEEIASAALAELKHLRWPKHLQNKPFEQLKHLARRKI